MSNLSPRCAPSFALLSCAAVSCCSVLILTPSPSLHSSPNAIWYAVDGDHERRTSTLYSGVQ